MFVLVLVLEMRNQPFVSEKKRGKNDEPVQNQVKTEKQNNKDDRSSFAKEYQGLYRYGNDNNNNNNKK